MSNVTTKNYGLLQLCCNFVPAPTKDIIRNPIEDASPGDFSMRVL